VSSRSVAPRRAGILFAIGASVWSAVCTAGDAQPAAALPEALRIHLQNEQFQIVTSVRGLPLGVRDALQQLFGSQSLDIAEPHADFQSTGVAVNSGLPIRRLVAAGCAIDHCLVYYERGGVPPTWHLALFHWTPDATRFEWGGAAPGGLSAIDNVRTAVLSGKIKGGQSVW